MTARNLVIKFNEIPASGLQVAYSNQSGELNTVLFDLMGDYPVYKFEADIQSHEQSVQLKGKVQGELRHVCSRCADEFSTTFNKKFTTTYQQGDSLEGLPESIDVTEGTFELEFVQAPELDLGSAIHEQVALEVPFQPICKDACLGLCFQCGTNLNETSCQCKPASIKHQSPFEKLKVLKENN